MLLMPESPVYLLKKGLTDPARKSLQWLRGPDYDIEKEFQQVTRVGRALADSSHLTHINFLKILVSCFDNSFPSALFISKVRETYLALHGPGAGCLQEIYVWVKQLLSAKARPTLQVTYFWRCTNEQRYINPFGGIPSVI